MATEIFGTLSTDPSMNTATASEAQSYAGSQPGNIELAGVNSSLWNFVWVLLILLFVISVALYTNRRSRANNLGH